MNKGLIVETAFMTKSGQGTPMFSRPGKGTCAEYMVFKEPHQYHAADPIEEEKPEEVAREQLKSDLLGKEEDVFGSYIQDILDKDEEELEKKKLQEEESKKKELEDQLAIEKPHVNNDHGKKGNTSMFRTVPREVLEEREDTRIFKEYPKSTKYSPNVGYIQRKIVKNVAFGEKGEDETQKRIKELRDKIQNKIVCSKGATSCFSSVKRVKAQAKEYVRETFAKPSVLLSERRQAIRKNHAVSSEPTEDHTFDDDWGGAGGSNINKIKFYVSPFKRNLGPDQYLDKTKQR